MSETHSGNKDTTNRGGGIAMLCGLGAILLLAFALALSVARWGWRVAVGG